MRQGDHAREDPPPRGGDLFTLLAADLPGCVLRRADATTALVLVDDHPRFLLETRIERRRLLTLQTTVAHVLGPETAVTGRLELRHTGQLRRTGLEAKLLGPDVVALATLRDRLFADAELRAASLELDFTRFVVEPCQGRWRASLELMGGSHVRTTLPPSSRYVRLSPDQIRPLVTTIAVLRRRLPADDAALPAVVGRQVDPSTVPAPDGAPTAGADHLPRTS